MANRETSFHERSHPQAQVSPGERGGSIWVKISDDTDSATFYFADAESFSAFAKKVAKIEKIVGE